MLNGGDIAVNNTTLAANVASFQFADRPGGWGGGIYVDKASKASLAYATIVPQYSAICRRRRLE